MIPDDQLWMVIVGFIVAFALAFAIGANDVANTFGSSVGSKVLSIRQACTIATVCEMAGALLLGSTVSGTIRKGIVDTSMFDKLEKGPSTLMVGQVATLCGSCIWLLIATFFRLPVSGTHSIVGATVGFSLVQFGVKAINWVGLGKIVASWFISPALSGLVSVGIFSILHYLVLIKDQPLEPALRLLPGFYGSVIAINLISVLLAGTTVFHFDKIPLYGVLIVGCGGGTITVICVKLFLIPYLRRRILAGDNAGPNLGDRIYTALRCHRVEMLCQRLRRDRKVRTIVDNEENGGQRKPTEINIVVEEASPDLNSSRNGRNRKTSVDDRHESVTSVSGRQNSFRLVPTKFEVTTTKPAEPPAEPVHYLAVRAYPTEHDLSVTRRGMLSQPVLPPIGEEEPQELEIISDRPHEYKVFSQLQILTAVFDSFAHGGNDVSNAIGPVMGLWIVGVTQEVNSKMANPYWILIYGGVGISIGLWIWGRRVIKTLGEDLTIITPSSGVCIELGSAMTVLFASKLGLPISTTHCQVGSVVAVGRFRSRDNVDWRIFRNVIIAWVVTVPAACGISALLMYLLSFAI
ncbi:hypothetical protein CRM22_009513 [Opisthorchis felineus]|uniref:Phosphate transporter n=1 Tax=Opisthorchis felineus TaxID=147828 RepID=A0A4S2L7B5_OPIFE|nr:hypothetical protein CRM22_009513 [Opisthorchis felineus]